MLTLVILLWYAHGVPPFSNALRGYIGWDRLNSESLIGACSFSNGNGPFSPECVHILI